ncbi:MAG TPA: class IV adenylate cyclase [Planctomycetaceae bacterium]|nr:class IV adenylate cyclase [Planctomycetaceae bacterium]
MQYEVEVKYPMPSNGGAQRLQVLLEELRRRGAERVGERRQVDTYFAHPARDFTETDEALRVRFQPDGLTITYKGPRVDSLTKTRQEIQVSLVPSEQALQDLRRMLAALGFRPVRDVVKRRQVFRLLWEGREVQVCVDEVDGLGSFVEIETMADESSRDAARDSVLRLAETFGLRHSERRSYLQLLLEQDARG